MSKKSKVMDIGKQSDGYHTFDELYEHRHWLFLHLLSATHPDRAWASKLHADGTSYDGWFVAGIELPSGKISYHLPNRLWSVIELLGIETDDPPEWDGHTSDDVLKRLEEDALCW